MGLGSSATNTEINVRVHAIRETPEIFLVVLAPFSICDISGISLMGLEVARLLMVMQVLTVG